MSFLDGFEKTILAPIFIIVLIIMWYVYSALAPTITAGVSASLGTQLSNDTTNTFNFFNASFPVIFILVNLCIAVAAAYVSSSPVFLIVYFMLNVALLVVYDSMDSFLQSIANSSVNNPGVMSIAVSFFHGDVGKLLVVINMIIAIALLSKRRSEAV